MKTTFLKYYTFILLMAFVAAGCAKEDKNENNLVIKEFPVLYTGYNLVKDETVVIHDQAAFDNVFSGEIIAKNLTMQNIDFSKYDVLAGQGSTPYGPAKPKHKFMKRGNLSYLYLLDISNEIVGVPMNFCYGIIVNKLPAGSVVNFEVTRD